MNMRAELITLLQMMVDSRYITEFQMGYVIGVVDMATLMPRKQNEEDSDEKRCD